MPQQHTHDPHTDVDDEFAGGYDSEALDGGEVGTPNPHVELELGVVLSDRQLDAVSAIASARGITAGEAIQRLVEEALEHRATSERGWPDAASAIRAAASEGSLEAALRAAQALGVDLKITERTSTESAHSSSGVVHESAGPSSGGVIEDRTPIRDRGSS